MYIQVNYTYIHVNKINIQVPGTVRFVPDLLYVNKNGEGQIVETMSISGHILIR